MVCKKLVISTANEITVETYRLNLLLCPIRRLTLRFRRVMRSRLLICVALWLASLVALRRSCASSWSLVHLRKRERELWSRSQCRQTGRAFSTAIEAIAQYLAIRRSPSSYHGSRANVRKAES